MKTYMQTFGTRYNPAFSGEVRASLCAPAPAAHGRWKIIACRAAMELLPHAVTNPGIGMLEGGCCRRRRGLEGLCWPPSRGHRRHLAGGKDPGAAINADCIPGPARPVRFL